MLAAQMAAPSSQMFRTEQMWSKMNNIDNEKLKDFQAAQMATPSSQMIRTDVLLDLVGHLDPGLAYCDLNIPTFHSNLQHKERQKTKHYVVKSEKHKH